MLVSKPEFCHELHHTKLGRKAEVDWFSVVKYQVGCWEIKFCCTTYINFGVWGQPQGLRLDAVTLSQRNVL